MTHIDWNLLARYLAEACTPEEVVQVERWLAESRQHRAILEAARRVATTADRRIVPERKVAMLAAIEASPRVRPVSNSWRPVQTARGSMRRYWLVPLRTAAAVLIVALGAIVGGTILSRSPDDSRPAAWRVASTVPGQRATFRLPDGSFVLLGVASRLRYPAAFECPRNVGGCAREVIVEGEAYFDVVHDDQRPFVVRAGDLVAQDLGTAFTVRAYAEDSHGQVVVREGEVAIRAAASPTAPSRVVAPGQLGRLAATGEPTVEVADTAVYFAWTSGRLAFRGTSLRDAVVQLRRWYGIDVRLGSPALGTRRFAASFDRQPAVDVLRWIAAAVDLKLTQVGSTYTLRAE